VTLGFQAWLQLSSKIILLAGIGSGIESQESVMKFEKSRARKAGLIDECLTPIGNSSSSV
jgi:hypothetical protein